MRGAVCPENARGFGLIEIMVALTVLTFGLLAVGQLILVSAGSGSLARSKGTTAVAAQNKLEILSDLYWQDPSAVDLAPGSHGPQQIGIVNPVNGSTLNYYSIEWAVAEVPDPRPGKTVDAKLVAVKIAPVHFDGSANKQPLLNKALNAAAIIGPRMP